MTRVYLLVLFVAVTTLGLLPVAAGKADDPIDPRLEKILADWQKRQHWFDSVEYQVSGKRVTPKGAISEAYDDVEKQIQGIPTNQVLPPKQMEGPIRFVLLLDLIKGRERESYYEKGLNYNQRTGYTLVESEKTYAYNGTEMKVRIPRDKNPGMSTNLPEMTTVKGNMKTYQFIARYYPLFFAHGRIFTCMEPILPGQFRNKPDHKAIYIHGTVVYQDRQCLALRTIPITGDQFVEYWVDTSRENSIVRHMMYDHGSLFDEISIEYAMNGNHWIPTSWRLSVPHHGKLKYFEDMTVEHVRFNPTISDDDFEFPPPKPGTLVNEHVDLPTPNPLEIPKSKLSVYRVDDKGERIQIPDPLHRPNDQYEMSSPRRNSWLSIFLIIVAGLVAFIFFRRSRKG